jgi:hypothetical protein
MYTVEEYYKEYALRATLDKIVSGQTSPYIVKLYQATKARFPTEMKSVSLEKTAAYTANWNPNKCSIGQKAQIAFLKQAKFPNLASLPAHGKNAIALKNTSKGVCIGLGKSDINGVKTFDAIDRGNKKISLFAFKAVDLGEFSDNQGGGHQNNVGIEVKTLILSIGSSALFYEKLPVDVYIVIDGRLADKFIEDGKKLLHKNTCIIIGKCEDL